MTNSESKTHLPAENYATKGCGMSWWHTRLPMETPWGEKPNIYIIEAGSSFRHLWKRLPRK